MVLNQSKASSVLVGQNSLEAQALIMIYPEIQKYALREYSAGQITIQCSEGSPATGQHPRNDNCHDIGESMISSGSAVE
jgi:hypothetical protein